MRQRVLVVAGEDYHPGVIGIVASHLVERYGKPTVVLDMKADGTACGSARSIEGFDLYRAVAACSQVLTRFGGHPMAAGMGLAAADIPVFARAINAYAEKEYPRMPALQLHLDCKLSPAYLTLDLAENLQLLEPCGTDNLAALFGLFHLQLVSVSPLGAEGKHLRLEAEKKGRRLRIVQFGVKPEDFPYVPGDFIDCAVQISKIPIRAKSIFLCGRQMCAAAARTMTGIITSFTITEPFCKTVPTNTRCTRIGRFAPRYIGS